jgi:hypothetical protein
MEKINLSEKEVAASRGIGLRQLRMMRMRGVGPRYIKISGRIGESGGRVLYPVRDLDAWLQSCPSGGEQTAAAPAAKAERARV